MEPVKDLLAAFSLRLGTIVAELFQALPYFALPRKRSLTILGFAMKAVPALLFLVCMAGVCQAKTEFKSTTGDCDGSSVGWWSMSRYDDGRLIET